jgi:DNA-binding response OmpR family regulator
MQNIFIVEDELKLRQELITMLERNGYECEGAEDFENIVETVTNKSPDLLLLDINLPVYDGFYICREIRKKSDLPIIVVTSNNSDMDELEIMNMGADDFIAKPFNPRILLAHIESVLKRTSKKPQSIILTHKGLSLDVLKSTASYNGNCIDLTKNELGILKVLMENKGNIIPRNEIIRVLWEMEDFIEDATLTVNINRLRKKLNDIGLDDYLITKRGQGYTV